MTMITNLKQWFLGLICLSGLLMSAQTAQAQCTSCTATLPSGIPSDTIYLDSFPNAVRGQYYEEVANFRFPYSVAGLGSFAPAGSPNINLQSFSITGVSGLPLGLTWTGDQATPMLYDEVSPDTRDGCIRVCGIPQQSGTFTVNVSIVVTTGLLPPQNQNIPVTFVVEPSAGAAFAMDTSAGCAPLTVTFTNLIQTLGNETWAYNWNFGDGTTSTAFAPPAVTYSDSGTYNVNMRAISTLALPRTYLSSVTVTAVGCTDPFNAVDLFLTIGTAAGAVDTVTAFVANTAPPLITNFGTDLDLIAGTSYSIWVQDDDAIASGIPGPADCGTVYFNSDTLLASANPVFNLTNGALSVRVRLTRDTVYQYDTVYTEDIIVVTDCDTTVSVTRYNVSEDVSLQVYPNPTTGDVNLSFELAEAAAEDVQINVYDALGRVVGQQVWAGGQARYNERISLGDYGAGIYIVQMRIGNKQWHKKVVVQK